jgi:hypothetical protein
MAREISVDTQSVHAEVIDHSEEFVAIVQQSALAVYHTLVDSPQVRGQLSASNNFNYGKAYAYAEYIVFRKEFLHRFPQASVAACINSFCGLLLKNDISITNLVDYMEQSLGPEIERLAKK